MTARDDFDRHLSAWLDDRAPVREPELLLGQVLARTARTRRRPAWLIPERWIPMSSISTRLAPTSRVPWRPVALVALLIVALIVGAIVISGSRQPKLPPPFGLAANGTIAYSTNGDILVADSPLGEPRVIVGGATNDNGPLYSPNGTRIAFVRGTIGAADAQLWAALADGSGARMLTDASTVGWVEWSPQSDTLAVLRDDAPSTISLVDVDTGHVTPMETGLAYLESLIWRPADGAQLTFRARDDSGFWGIYLMDRSGGNVHRLVLDPGYESDMDYLANKDVYFQGPAWSADGTRLLYYTLEPAPGSPAGPGFRNHVATVDAAGAVTSDRVVDFDPATDDEFAGSWLGAGDDILFQTVEGTEHRLVVGSVAASHGPGRDLGVSAQDWFSMVVSPDAKSVLVNLPASASGPAAVESVDLASGTSTPISLPGGDLTWQRVAPKS